MIYISTAIYCEAEPFISRLGLKKDLDACKFQIFKNDDFTLIITGTGPLNAAIGVTYMLTRCSVVKEDFFMNIGICGSVSESHNIGDKILCSKIIDYSTENTYYSDMIYKHNFLEGTLETFPFVLDKDRDVKVEGEYVDMEGAGAFKAASVFLGPHKIYCIKILSDYMDGCVNSSEISNMVEGSVDEISMWVLKIQDQTKLGKEVFSNEEKEMLLKIVNNLKLTISMKNDLKKAAIGYKLNCENLMGAIKPFTELSCESKNEGKAYFAKLRRKLVEF